ncbi:MAG: hypothetical protein ACK58T_02555, partial [Phycisphaerae bacterium]
HWRNATGFLFRFCSDDDTGRRESNRDMGESESTTVQDPRTSVARAADSDTESTDPAKTADHMVN